jgi:hypothetical protein
MYGVQECVNIIFRYVNSISDSDILTVGPYHVCNLHTVVSNERFLEKHTRKIEREHFGCGRWTRNNVRWSNIMCMPSAHAQSPASASDKRMVGIHEQQICRHEVLQLIQNLPRIFGTQRKFAPECHTAHVLWYLHPQWRMYYSNEVQ